MTQFNSHPPSCTAPQESAWNDVHENSSESISLMSLFEQEVKDAEQKAVLFRQQWERIREELSDHPEPNLQNHEGESS